MNAPALVTVDVAPFVVLVQRVDYGDATLRRPTYRCVGRRVTETAQLFVGYYYHPCDVEPSAFWTWGGDRLNREEKSRIESAVERVVEAAGAELDAELEHRRRARRGLVEHG